MPPHFDTPTKSKILGAKQFIDFLKEKEGPQAKKHKLDDIAECFNTSTKQVSKICSQKRPRRTLEEETRGGYRGDDILHLTKENLNDAEEVIENNGYDGHNLDFGALRHEAQLPRVSERTLQKRLREEKNIGRYIAATKEEVSPEDAAARVTFAEYLLRTFPTKEAFRQIRFSDEFHYGYGDEENKHYIFRKKGIEERKKPDCIRLISSRKQAKKKKEDAPKRDNERNDEATKEVHFFAIVGYDFKPPLYEYTVPSNKNGKMSANVYIDILKKNIEPLLKRGDDFILEEDRDGAHYAKSVLKYKESIGLKYYLNAKDSPDLSVVETCAGISKTEFRKGPRVTVEDIRGEAIRSWNLITQKSINNAIDSMPARCRAVIDARGQKTLF
jgi:hypothetical protein